MLKKTFIGIIIVLIGIQFIPVTRDNPPFNPANALVASTEVMEILKTSCYDCHSNETHYSIYSQIAPLYWGVRAHIKDGRKALNFSTWKEMKPFIKNERLKRLPNTLKMGFMPLRSYSLFHPKTTLSSEQKQILIDWANAEEEKLKMAGGES